MCYYIDNVYQSVISGYKYDEVVKKPKIYSR